MDTLVVVLSAPLGLAVGLAVRVLADGISAPQPLQWPPRCGWCGRRFAGPELVPVLSWVWRRHRCGSCGGRRSVADPLIEVVTAALFVAGAARFGASWVLVPFLVLFAVLVAVSIVDLRQYRIPDRIVFPSLAVSIPLIVAVSAAIGRLDAVPWALTGAVVFTAVLLLASLFPGGMGFGDVKLALVLGLYLGWLGSDLRGMVLLVFAALALGSLVGVVTGLAVGLVRVRFGRDLLPDPDARPDQTAARSWTKQAFPFGPALGAGTVAAVLFSNSIL